MATDSPQVTTLGDDTFDFALDAFELDGSSPSHDWTFLLNPNAPAFAPPWIVTNEQQQRKIDDAMSLLHHCATVNDSDSLAEAEASDISKVDKGIERYLDQVGRACRQGLQRKLAA